MNLWLNIYVLIDWRGHYISLLIYIICKAIIISIEVLKVSRLMRFKSTCWFLCDQSIDETAGHRTSISCFIQGVHRVYFRYPLLGLDVWFIIVHVLIWAVLVFHFFEGIKIHVAVIIFNHFSLVYRIDPIKHVVFSIHWNQTVRLTHLQTLQSLAIIIQLEFFHRNLSVIHRMDGFKTSFSYFLHLLVASHSLIENDIE